MSDPMPPTGDRPLVELRRVWFRYGDRIVLENIQLTVEKGDFLCIVGPNGGGKTTLLRLILGLLDPSEGEVRVFGAPPRESRVRIGYMPQRLTFDPLFPADVMDVVLMGRLGGGWTFGPCLPEDKRAAEKALEQVGLKDLRRRPIASLSGGQLQRALIARALVTSPEILILDEPTANLDLYIEGELLSLLRGLNEKVTIVMVSHDLGFVSRIVTRVVCLNRRATVHTATALTGEMIADTYGGEVRMIQHSHSHPAPGTE